MQVKIFFVTLLLASLLLVLISSVDLIQGFSLHNLLSKELNPFRVMEPAEYIILILFVLFFLINAIGAFLNKKKGNNPSSS